MYVNKILNARSVFTTINRIFLQKNRKLFLGRLSVFDQKTMRVVLQIHLVLSWKKNYHSILAQRMNNLCMFTYVVGLSTTYAPMYYDLPT